MLKTKRAQLKTMLAHALIFDSPYGMEGRMQCGGSKDGKPCRFHRAVMHTTPMPGYCPDCNLVWRFCTAPLDPYHDPEIAARIFNQRMPYLSFFVVDEAGTVLKFTLAHLRR